MFSVWLLIPTQQTLGNHSPHRTPDGCDGTTCRPLLFAQGISIWYGPNGTRLIFVDPLIYSESLRVWQAWDGDECTVMRMDVPMATRTFVNDLEHCIKEHAVTLANTFPAGAPHH